MLLRFIILHQHRRISENHWRATSVLKSHSTVYKILEGEEGQAVKAAISLVMEMTSTDLVEDDLLDLYWCVSLDCLTDLTGEDCSLL